MREGGEGETQGKVGEREAGRERKGDRKREVSREREGEAGRRNEDSATVRDPRITFALSDCF